MFIQFILDLLRLLGKEELYDAVWWTADLHFFVGCNDVFGYACADAEEITPEQLPLLRQAIADAKEADNVVGSCYGCLLFAARVRGMRPLKASYPREQKLWPLFDACGPEREIGFWNLHK